MKRVLIVGHYVISFSMHWALNSDLFHFETDGSNVILALCRAILLNRWSSNEYFDTVEDMCLHTHLQQSYLSWQQTKTDAEAVIKAPKQPEQWLLLLTNILCPNKNAIQPFHDTKPLSFLGPQETISWQYYPYQIILYLSFYEHSIGCTIPLDLNIFYLSSSDGIVPLMFSRRHTAPSIIMISLFVIMAIFYSWGEGRAKECQVVI